MFHDDYPSRPPLSPPDSAADFGAMAELLEHAGYAVVPVTPTRDDDADLAMAMTCVAAGDAGDWRIVARVLRDEVLRLRAAYQRDGASDRAAVDKALAEFWRSQVRRGFRDTCREVARLWQVAGDIFTLRGQRMPWGRRKR